MGQVIVKLVDYYRKTRPQEQIKSVVTGRKSQTGGVIVKGLNGLLVRFAGCCNPVPGDEIVGFISRGHGVTVHRKDCTNLKNAEDGRLIEVSWENQTSTAFNAEIKVIGGAQSDILFAVAAATSELQLEIVATNGRTDAKTGRVIVDFTIRLKDKAALDRLITKLKQDKRVEDVFRATST